MTSQKRMIYQMVMPDIAVGPGPTPLGSIEGRGVMVPAVDCPMPRHGNRSPLNVCFDCNKLKEVGAHYIDCEYQQSAQDKAEMQRRAGQPVEPPPQQQGPHPQPVPHPGVQPPVPPNVFNPKQ